MISKTVERLFVPLIKQVFSNGYFGYSVTCEGKTERGYELSFSMDGKWSPYAYDLEKRHGTKINIRLVDFLVYGRVDGTSNIKMTVRNAKNDGKNIVVPFDDPLRIELQTYSVGSGRFVGCLTDLIIEAMKGQ